jgi:hypothetical protein
MFFDWVWKVVPRSRRVNVALPCISVQHDVVMPIFPLNKRVQAKSITAILTVAEREYAVGLAARSRSNRSETAVTLISQCCTRENWLANQL